MEALLELSFFHTCIFYFISKFIPKQCHINNYNNTKIQKNKPKVAKQNMSQSYIRSCSSSLLRTSSRDISSRSHYTKNYSKQINKIMQKKYVPEIDGLDIKLMKMTGVFSSNVDSNPMRIRFDVAARPGEHSRRVADTYNHDRIHGKNHYQKYQSSGIMSYRSPVTRSKSSQLLQYRQCQDYKNYISGPYLFNNQNRNLKYKGQRKQNNSQNKRKNIQFNKQQQNYKQKKISEKVEREALKIKQIQNNIECHDCSTIKGKKQIVVQKNVNVVHVYHHHAKNRKLSLQKCPIEGQDKNKNLKAIHHLAQNQNFNIEFIKSTLNNKIKKQAQSIQSSNIQQESLNSYIKQKQINSFHQPQKPLATQNKVSLHEKYNASLSNSQILPESHQFKVIPQQKQPGIVFSVQSQQKSYGKEQQGLIGFQQKQSKINSSKTIDQPKSFLSPSWNSNKSESRLQKEINVRQGQKCSAVTNAINNYLRNQIYKIGSENIPNSALNLKGSLASETNKNSAKQVVSLRKSNIQNSGSMRISEPKYGYVEELEQESKNSKFQLVNEQGYEQKYQNNILKDSKSKANSRVQTNPQQETKLIQQRGDTKAFSNSTELRQTPKKQLLSLPQQNSKPDIMDLTDYHEDEFFGNCCTKMKQDCAIF